MTKIFSTRITRKLTAISLAILLISLSIFITSFFFYQNSNQELVYIQNSKMDFNQLKFFFKDLAQKKGAVYAFKVLDKAPLPPSAPSHLLGHIVGDELYKQKGINGIEDCTDSLRNACSHSLTINFFYEKGEVAIKDVAKACEKAPGEANAYRLCYHGLGHGILAYSNYDLSKTIDLCKKAATEFHNYREYPECIGGAIMEQISGGDHDKKSWQQKRKLNLKPEDPFYPCYSIITDQEARVMCLSYLTPFLFEISGQNTLVPSDETIKKAFAYCNKIPIHETQDRLGCFGGFGKEFTPLAKNNDVRKINKLTNEEIERIYRWCLLSPSQDGQFYCLSSAQKSIYWSGAVDKKYVINFCNQAPTQSIKDDCFKESISTISIGNKNLFYNLDFCRQIPLNLEANCINNLASKPFINLFLPLSLIHTKDLFKIFK